jgi:hypothetical protein
MIFRKRAKGAGGVLRGPAQTRRDARTRRRSSHGNPIAGAGLAEGVGVGAPVVGWGRAVEGGGRGPTLLGLARALVGLLKDGADACVGAQGDDTGRVHVHGNRIRACASPTDGSREARFLPRG